MPMTKREVALVVLLSLLSAQCGRAPDGLQGRLAEGTSKEREISAGQSHRWELVIEQDQFVAVEVAPHDIDLVVKIHDSRGGLHKEVNRTGSGAAEYAGWIPDSPGRWSVEILPWETNQPGTYTIAWTDRRPATDTDRRLQRADADLAAAVHFHEEFRLAAAESLQAVAAEIYLAELGGSDPRFTFALLKRADLHLSGGLYAEARQEATRALDGRVARYGRSHPELIPALLAQAEACRLSGLPAEASRPALRALEIAEASLPPNHVQGADILRELAHLKTDENRYGEANLILHRALQIYEATLPADHLKVAGCLFDLANCYSDRFELDEAEGFHLQALAREEKLRLPDHPRLATNYTHLGELYRLRKEYDKSEYHFEKALAIQAEYFPADHVALAPGLSRLGTLYYEQNRYEDAIRAYRRALAARERWLGPDHPETAVVLTNLARTLFFQGETPAPELLAMVNRTIRIYDTSRVLPEYGFIAYLQRGYLFMVNGDLDAAVADFDHAFERLDRFRPHLGGSFSRAVYFQYYIRFFDDMIFALFAAGRTEKAIDYLERTRARVLLDELAASKVDLLASLPEDLRNELTGNIRRAEAEVTALQQRLSVTGADSAGGLGDQLLAAQRAAQQAYDNLRNASPIWRDQITSGGRPVRLPTIQNDLVPPDGLILVYQISRDRGALIVIPGRGEPVTNHELKIDEGLTAPFGLTAGAPVTADAVGAILAPGLADSQAVGVVRQLGDPNRGTQGPGGPPAPHLVSYLHALRRTLVPDEVWTRVAAASEVIIVPDADLHLLPFAALVVEKPVPEGPPEKVTFWLDTGPVIRYASSATSLYNLELREGSHVIPLFGRAYVLSLSNPAFDRVQSGLAPLPATAFETTAIREAFRELGKEQVILSLQEAEATEKNLRDSLAGMRFIHLGTHGILQQEDRRLYASLAFSPGAGQENDPADDGFLHLHEIYGLKLPDCELAVLSACQSNVGSYIEGEGVLALSRAFLAAGARRVVASQWSLEDRSTAEIIGEFFRLIGAAERDGQRIDYAHALREAKLKVRNQPRWADPFYWAPFVITGKR